MSKNEKLFNLSFKKMREEVIYDLTARWEPRTQQSVWGQACPEHSEYVLWSGKYNDEKLWFGYESRITSYFNTDVLSKVKTVGNVLIPDKLVFDGEMTITWENNEKQVMLSYDGRYKLSCEDYNGVGRLTEQISKLANHFNATDYNVTISPCKAHLHYWSRKGELQSSVKPSNVKPSKPNADTKSVHSDTSGENMFNLFDDPKSSSSSDGEGMMNLFGDD